MLLAAVATLVTNFNPRPPWGGRRRYLRQSYGRHAISIHALRGEGDLWFFLDFPVMCLFQSTPSVGRAT